MLLVELLNCLGAGINSEMGTELGGRGGDDVYASATTVVVGA